MNTARGHSNPKKKEEEEEFINSVQITHILPSQPFINFLRTPYTSLVHKTGI